MRSVALRFLLPVSLITAGLAAFILHRTYVTTRAHVHEVVKNQAKLALEFDLAVRDYVGHVIRPEMEKLVGPNDFVPETMSTSYVARSVFERVREQCPDYVLKFSSDDPRNPANLAGPAELAVIEEFNNDPKLERLTKTVSMNGRRYLAHFSARRMTESCLRCHGDPAAAPKSLIDRYGPVAGFHRPVGQIIALDTIAIPVDAIEATLASEVLRESIILGVGVLASLLGLILVFRRVVTHRLSAMASHFDRIASAPDNIKLEPISANGRDEIAHLARSFNTLAARLHVAHEELETRVVARTHELARANEELQYEVEQRKSAQLAAQAASVAKSEFLANMSHEIRTPMTAILGYADVVHGEIGTCAAYDDQPTCERRRLNQDAIEAIRRNGQFLLEILNDILDLSKIEAGKLLIERQACHPRQVIDDVIQLVRVRADARCLPLVVEYDEALPEHIETDPTRLRQLLFNIVGNAVKFTEAGHVRVAVTRHDDGLDEWLRIDVVDTGAGVAPEHQERLFEAFSQADASASRIYGGTGLGLSISQRVARLMGGSVQLVRSTLGEGSHFRIELPLYAAMGAANESPIPDAIPQDAPPTPRDDKPLAGVHVLMAEDGPDNQRLVSHFLRRAGATCEVVENGQLAIERITSPQPGVPSVNLILMDMQMPVLDGYAAARTLREKRCDIPIIALTAHAMADDRQKCIDAGCSDYLSKPIDRGKLVDTVLRHMTGARPGAF